MPLQTTRDLHVDQVLSNWIVGRTPPGFIADQIVPILPVNKRSDLFYKRNYKENIGYTPNLDRMAPGASAREVFWSVSSDNFFCEKFGLGTFWTTEDEVNADEALQYDQESSQFVTDRLMMAMEMRIAGLFVSANVATITHVATAWSNTTGSRPYDDVLQLIENFRVRTAIRPNVAILGENVAQYLRRNDQIRDLLFGDRGGIPTDDQLATLFKVGKFIVPETFVNTQGPGETFAGSGSLSNVWGDTMKLLYVAGAPGRRVDTWVQGFRWNNPKLGTPFAIRRMPYDPKHMRQDIDAIYYQSEKIVSSDLCTIVDSLV